MQTQTLSESALALLHRRLAGERVEVTEATRPLYRELVEAGMMMPLHTFSLGTVFKLDERIVCGPGSIRKQEFQRHPDNSD
jgi:hypothetical protein